MRIALIDSGLGSLTVAAALHRLDPEAELILAMDPDHMPWGVRPDDEVRELALASARAAARLAPDAIVLACNTSSVAALFALREEFEPDLPVVGTVPAVKPAAEAGRPFAVWATPSTTQSAYQRSLVETFAQGMEVAEIACPGLADAIEAGDLELIRQRVAEFAAATPSWCSGLVLGCTHYPLASRIIAAALKDRTLFDSSEAVARQSLRRARESSHAAPNGQGRRLRVLLSGREGPLPKPALTYEEGRLLAALELSA